VTFKRSERQSDNLIAIQLAGTNDGNCNPCRAAFYAGLSHGTMALTAPSINGTYLATVLQGGAPGRTQVALATSVAFTVTGGTNMMVSADKSSYVGGPIRSS